MRSSSALLALMGFGLLGTGCADPPTSPRAAMNAPGPEFAAVTPAMRTEFAGLIQFCSQIPEVVNVTPGRVLHLKGHATNLFVTGNPLVDGPEENTFNLTNNLKTGDGGFSTQGTIMPDAVDGTWEVDQRVNIRADVPNFGHATGHGTGELQGMTIKYDIEATPGASDCNPALGRANIEGVILSPASTS